VSRLQRLVLRAVQRASGGRAITYAARARVPILRAERFAQRRTAQDLAFDPGSPLIEPYEAPPVAPGVLDGDVIVKDQVDVAGLRTGIGMADGGERADSDATIIARVRAAGGRVIGKAGSGAGGIGLAMIRLDKFDDALAAGEPVLAGGLAVSADKP
jgi:hypothetical protein